MDFKKAYEAYTVLAPDLAKMNERMEEIAREVASVDKRNVQYMDFERVEIDVGNESFDVIFEDRRYNETACVTVPAEYLWTDYKAALAIKQAEREQREAEEAKRKADRVLALKRADYERLKWELGYK